MARMYGKGKGISRSALPFKRSVPTWCKTPATDIVKTILQFSRKGMMPSQIGVTLRDQTGIPRVKAVTDNTIVRILRKAGMAPEIPEDLYCLMRKAVSIRKHMERNRSDKDAKFRLILVESKIHRLARYYKSHKKIAPTWKYTAAKASTAVA